MNLIGLLRRNLKDPEIIEVLDHYDFRVQYDFDRDFENRPDSYWAESLEHGFALRFDENQRLVTIFVYVQAADGLNRCSLETLDFDLFEDFDSARSNAERKQLRHSLNAGEPGIPQWLRIEHETHFVHYEFNDSGLRLVTLMLPETAPGAR
ncbi:MAG: hypothetical protein QNI99_05115 [Woeseiaceae bacterium]|nr:hypothetical protein [Woeseiaceae bacterium]